MTRLSIGLATAALCAFLCGCGHNVVVYGDGFGFKVGFIPEQYAVGVQMVHGKMITACVRENAKVSLDSTIDGSAQQGESKGQGLVNNGVKFNMEIGEQVTGYTVDLEEAKQGRQ